MRNIFYIVITVLVSFASCKHEALRTAADNLPKVNTGSVNNITANSATVNGEVTAEGQSPVTEKGICWSTTPNPTTANNKAASGNGTGAYSVVVPGLSANTKYYARAYAINASGTAYGQQAEFTTLTNSPSLATVVTNNTSYDVSTNSISTGGNVTSEGGGSVTERGICWSTSVNPTINDNKKIVGNGAGSFSTSITGLIANTTYYVRAYAVNSAGVAYGDNKTVTTPSGGTPTVPSLTTNTATYNAASSTISTGGNITNSGGSNISARGVCWSTSPNPTTANNKTTDGTGTGSFTSTITGVAAGTALYIRAYATNTTGTGYGNEVVVTASSGSSYTIGQSFGGGIIFFIDASGQHGLIAAIQDVGAANGTAWDTRNNPTIVGASSNTDGLANTNAIVNALQNTQTYAARLCKTFTGGGFNDWYLPSKSELNLLYQQRTAVGNFNLSSGVYWSSTEVDKDKAWTQEFRTGSNSGRQKEENKDNNLLVRPIRAF